MGAKTYSILVFLCITLLTANAQQSATVRSFLQTTDHIPGNERRSDLNGVPCALIKVQVVDDIERVEGNKIGKILNKGVEKWIYMCKGSRNIKIHLENHLPIKVQFADYHISELESNRVYELIINTGSSHPIPLNVKGNYLNMKFVPKHASVILWGENIEKRIEYPADDGLINLYLPYGRYHFSAKASNYHPKDSSVFVNDEKKRVEIRLQPILGDITIKCGKRKADIYVNGVKVTPKKDNKWTGKLPLGEYIVEARAKGYVPQLKKINVQLQGNTIVEFSDMVSISDHKTIGNITSNDVVKLKELVLKNQEVALNIRKKEEERARFLVDSLRDSNTYDILFMRDKSIIFCKISDVRANVIIIRQKGNEHDIIVPMREIENIQHSDKNQTKF